MVRWRQGAVGQPPASSAWICVYRCTVLSLRYWCMTAKHYLIVQHPRRHCLGGKNLEHPSNSFLPYQPTCGAHQLSLYGGSIPKDRRSLKVFWWESKLTKGFPGLILAFSWEDLLCKATTGTPADPACYPGSHGLFHLLVETPLFPGSTGSTTLVRITGTLVCWPLPLHQATNPSIL